MASADSVGEVVDEGGRSRSERDSEDCFVVRTMSLPSSCNPIYRLWGEAVLLILLLFSPTIEDKLSFPFDSPFFDLLAAFD